MVIFVGGYRSSGSILHERIRRVVKRYFLGYDNSPLALSRELKRRTTMDTSERFIPVAEPVLTGNELTSAIKYGL